MSKVIDIARDFSKTPGGRYRSDSHFSAEAFRDDVLEPALKEHGAVEVHLDGAMGFGSSFLEEAFGGLVRKHGPQVRAQLTFVTSTRPYVVARINQFMDEASGPACAQCGRRSCSCVP